YDDERARSVHCSDDGQGQGAQNKRCGHCRGSVAGSAWRTGGLSYYDAVYYAGTGTAGNGSDTGYYGADGDAAGSGKTPAAAPARRSQTGYPAAPDTGSAG